MASCHRSLLLLLVLVTAQCIQAQSPPPPPTRFNPRSPYQTGFNSSVAIVVVVLISALFFVAFVLVYFRTCVHATYPTTNPAGIIGARSRRQRGLDDDIIASFPTLVYSEVKEHKKGKGALECAVCLSEFEDDETLRILPKCDHVFHPDCIDAWLAAHVTCPVCRCNLEPDPNQPEPDKQPPPPPVTEHVVAIQEEEEEEEDRINADLERIINMKRAKSRARPVSLVPRAHSTGHSLVRPEDNLDRFTLRLPESVRNEIHLNRARSVAVPAGESSSRMWFARRNAGGSVRLGRSGRDRPGLLRNLSSKLPAWSRPLDRVVERSNGAEEKSESSSAAASNRV